MTGTDGGRDFTANDLITKVANCSALKNKPKLIILQACRNFYPRLVQDAPGNTPGNTPGNKDQKWDIIKAVNDIITQTLVTNASNEIDDPALIIANATQPGDYGPYLCT